MDYLLIIDGSSLLTTQFFGNLPREIMFAKTEEEKSKYYYKIMATKTGVYTNAVYGFVRTLLKILEEQKPTHLAVTWDVTRDTFRRELYPDYKGNRSETIAPLKDQFVLCQQLLSRMNVAQFMDRRYEADDFSGTLAAMFKTELPVKIMTKDHDYLQLVDENTSLWMIHSTAKKTEELYKKYGIKQDLTRVPDRCFEFTPDLVRKEFGVKPASVNSLKGLQGDSSDNIKGVPGIGEQTAVALIAEYETVDRLYEAIETAGEEGAKDLAAFWKDKLGIKRSPMSYLTKESDTELVGKKAAKLSELLATIKRDIELPDTTLDSLKVNIDAKETKKAFDELEFKSLEVSTGEKADPFAEVEFRVIEDLDEAESYIAGLKKKPAKSGYTGLSIQTLDEGLQGMAVCANAKEAVLIKTSWFINEDFLMRAQAELLSSGTCLCMIDMKDRMSFIHSDVLATLKEEGTERKVKDLAIAAYLLSPLDQEYSYTSLAQRFLDTSMSREEDGEKRALAEAFTAFNAAPAILSALDKAGMTPIYEQIELPLAFVLYKMQRRGIRASREALKEYGDSLSEGIEILKKRIYDAAGEEFNINSPKQLGEILFEKLKLPYGKKSKTGGYSTSADILEKLKIEDPIVADVLEYRTLSKLKSTYADGLAEYIREDGRIHTSFNQLVTATGRISSTEPNLQNIPIRMELGRKIRKVFTPKDGCYFVDADYSQIELRILAHMSGDEKLIEAYNSEQDIHRITASQVFKVPFEKVDSTLRSRAKAVNFGIVYGISSFGLGQDLNISRKEASDYIESYFETYPGIKKFLDDKVAEAKDKGYSTTLFGRRRPIPEMDSANFMQRQFGERIAMNSPIQGTAADIIKLAMIKVENRLEKEGLEAKLLLQIHDELLVEAPLKEKETVKQILEEEMSAAAELKVRLTVDVNEGSDWYEAK